MNDNILPPDFDGVVRFTNWTDTDFVGKWDNVAYNFPAMKTTPMVIRGAAPEHLMYIRKKFAKDLAEREFFKSKKYNDLVAQSPLGTGARLEYGIPYNVDMMADLIQKALSPLEPGRATASVLPPVVDPAKFHKDEDGSPALKVLASDKVQLVNGTPIA